MKTAMCMSLSHAKEQERFLGKCGKNRSIKAIKPCHVLWALSIFIYLGPGSDYVRIFFQGHWENQNNFAAQFSQGRFHFLQIHVSCLFQSPRCLRSHSPSFSQTTGVTDLHHPLTDSDFWIKEIQQQSKQEATLALPGAEANLHREIH